MNSDLCGFVAGFVGGKKSITKKIFSMHDYELRMRNIMISHTT